MSEFFLELFSEEIPSRLQINARSDLVLIFNKFFEDNEIIIKDKINLEVDFISKSVKDKLSKNGSTVKIKNT